MKANKKETRQYECEEFRIEQADNGDVIVRGHAAVFNSLSEDLGQFREKINRDAFDNVLKDTANLDVVALLNHDSNIVFGRSTSGTLKLKTDERGLYSEIRMPNTQAAKDTVELMRRGDLSKMSFGFYVGADNWAEERGEYIRTIEDVSRLVDVSIVTRPAYSQTDVAVRSLDEYKKEQEKKTTEQRETTKARLKLLKIKQ
jgi:HK97 family phage prohead protease